MRLILGTTLLLMGLAYYRLTGWYPQVDWLQTDPIRLFWPVGLTLAGLISVILAGRLLQRDPVLVSWTVFAIAGCLLLLPLLAAKVEQEDLERAETDRLMEVRGQLRLAMLREQQQQKELEAERRERMKTDRFAQYEGQVPISALDVIRSLDKEMREAVAAEAKAYQEALAQYPTRGLGTWTRFRDISELKVELEAHRELYARTRSFARFIETFEENYSTKIKALELRPPADRIAIAELQRILQTWEAQELFTYRQLDVQLLGTALKALNILYHQWGNWEYLPRENKLQFNDPNSEFEFFQAIQDMQAIVKELDTIEQ